MPTPLSWPVGVCPMTTQASTAAQQQPTEVLGIGRELTVPQQLACALRILAARGLAGEPVGPHHVGARRDAACGATRGASGGRRRGPPTSCASTPTARSSRASGTSRPRSSSTPSCTARAPTPPSSCTTIRTTRRCSPAWARRRAIVHQNSCIFDDELAFVDEYAGRRGRRRRRVARRAGRRARAASCSRTTARSSPARRSARRATRRSRSSACAASRTTAWWSGRSRDRSIPAMRASS